MRDRIKDGHLGRLIDRINEVTGSPAEPYTKTDEGYRANPGNYHIDGAYGGVALSRVCNEGGGVADVFGVGYVTKRQLYDLMRAFLAGVESAKPQPPRQ